MIATFFIEIILAIRVLFRYGKTTLTRRIGIFILFCLGFFQLAEFIVCRSGDHTFFWSRAGFVAITLLPPLGIHLGYSIVERTKRMLIVYAYGIAGLLCLYFALIPTSVIQAYCGGNYVIFRFPFMMNLFYGIYYNVSLVVGVVLAWTARSHCRGEVQKHKLFWLTIGYLVFMVPSGLVLLLHPETFMAIPSIMCGFAVILAVILYWKVLK